ncbi:MAG TPA: hypothetical protein VK741_22810 [Acetobacteraceae bacterium]|jgi:hypothetical protein|nr:hypothetical protein [Acetobacteraceae bacterium]
MQEKAIVYAVIAWLACWLVDLIVVVARGPVMIDPILKLLVVLVCLIIVLVGLARHGWLLAT